MNKHDDYIQKNKNDIFYNRHFLKSLIQKNTF